MQISTYVREGDIEAVMIATFSNSILTVDDVLGEGNSANLISDDAIESHRRDLQNSLIGWDHPRSAAEDRLFNEWLKENRIKIVG